VTPFIETAAFHHIGVACRDLDAEEGLFAALGYVRERDEVIDELQGVRARFMVGGGPRVELLSNLGDRGALSDYLRKGVKFYHVAYEVDDLDRATAQLAAAGGKRIVEPLPGIAFGMRPLCFVMLPNLVLIELISRV
jgi:methylmalonyl-CoA/ethylmalonyl-CoA epimerase